MFDRELGKIRFEPVGQVGLSIPLELPWNSHHRHSSSNTVVWLLRADRQESRQQFGRSDPQRDGEVCPDPIRHRGMQPVKDF